MSKEDQPVCGVCGSVLRDVHLETWTELIAMPVMKYYEDDAEQVVEDVPVSMECYTGQCQLCKRKRWQSEWSGEFF